MAMAGCWLSGAAEPAMPHASLVIGIGNPLRGDDGAGWRLVEELGPPHRAMHQLTPECAALLAASQRVLFVDACCAAAAGEPLLRPLAPGEAGPGFSHHLSPAELLAITARLYGRQPEAWQLLLPAAGFGHGTGLTPALQARLPAARRLLRRWLHPA